MNWIQIWYSWGDQEEPVKVPEGTDPWEYMKKLVINEAEVSQQEHAEENGIRFYPEERKIALHYGYDDQYCYYQITDTEDFDPPAEPDTYPTHEDWDAEDEGGDHD